TGSIEKLRKLSHYNSNQVPFFETIRWHRGLKRLTMLKREAISVFTGLPNLHKLSALSLLTPVNVINQAIGYRMGSRALLLLRATPPRTTDLNFNSSFFSKSLNFQNRVRSYLVRSGLEPPDLPRLAENARISLTPREVWRNTHFILQTITCPCARAHTRMFGQLQAVDLQSIQPAIRADTEGGNFRDDLPETFENREAMIFAVPNYEEPFIKVPKVLNKE
ncbi:hypothetical protein C3L33_21788, partial [Rhododendron williamsianum]